jgi:hypothetical protein
MDAARTQRVGEVLKNVATLGKTVKQPVAATNAAAANVKKALTEATSRLPVASSSWIRVGFYILAGVLAIAVILLAVDQWITPIFQRTPGGKGYIPVPGTDTTEVFWTKVADIRDIPIRGTDDTIPSATSLDNRNRFAITMDIYIQDEYPQSLPNNMLRTFFMLGTTQTQPKISVSLDNHKNTLYVKFFTTDYMTCVVDNVPIRKPFRLGVVVNGTIGEAYLNGKLVRSLRIGTPDIVPAGGDMIFNPSTIRLREGTTDYATSRGIKVMNVQTYGYVPTPDELEARMGSLLSASSYI